MTAQINNIRPEFDREIVDIVDYVMNYEISSRVAYDTAHYCLLDTLGCGLEALEYPACKKLLGGVEFYSKNVHNFVCLSKWLIYDQSRIV